MRIRDGKNSDPGWKKFKSGIRDKHIGSATLLAGVEAGDGPKSYYSTSKSQEFFSSFVPWKKLQKSIAM
jgi:hypothetical protein